MKEKTLHIGNAFLEFTRFNPKFVDFKILSADYTESVDIKKPGLYQDTI